MLSWALLIAILLVLGFAVFTRATDLVRMADSAAERARAVERGSARARLQYPHIDLSRCIGCGLCVEACPEEGVLDLLHGQAIVVHGARCVGHGRCAQECPVGAIAVTLGDLDERNDIPVLSAHFESPQVPGLFLAGEVTGFALVRTAIAHGTAVAAEVARRNGTAAHDADVLDLCVVGAGPAGLACSLEAKARGLTFVTIEQEELGGTVAKYPRRKLVMTQPVDLPLHGRLSRTSYSKEELMELWKEVALEHELPIHTGQQLLAVERSARGSFLVRTQAASYEARNVCLALGRRGTPRKLGVPGEELPKVAYSLLDAQSYRDRRILVVGGGDSAVEAALGLSEQPGNRVSLSYRRGSFSRIKARNEVRLLEALEAGRIEALLESEVLEISTDGVRLTCGSGDARREGWLANDEVFVFAGGIPPFQLLEATGVSFDPADRPASEPLADQGVGLGQALRVAFVFAAAALAWTLYQRSYYSLPLAQRPAAAQHALLRPSGTIGVGFGITSVALITTNLLYLLRRSLRIPLTFGSLRAWMTAHVGSGVLALLLALLHSAMAPRNTIGGHALGGLAVLVVTGAIGRYFYAFVPRATNGRELALEDVRSELAHLSSGWEQTNRDLGERIRRQVDELVSSGRWSGNLLARLIALVRSQSALHRALSEIEAEARQEGIPAQQIAELSRLARRAHRTALMAAHYEDLRGILSTWRYLHRWVALLMVLLVLLHVALSVRYANLFGGTP